MVAAVLMLALVLGDPDAVVMTQRSDSGALPLGDAAIEVGSPALTVSSAAQSLNTEQQIERWINDRPSTEPMPAWREQASSGEPRRVTGEVSLGIGTGDYSHGSAHVTLPLGEIGNLTLGFSQTKNGWYQRLYGRDGMFWDPRDAALGPQWITPAGRSYSPFGDDRRGPPDLGD